MKRLAPALLALLVVLILLAPAEAGGVGKIVAVIDQELKRIGLVDSSGTVVPANLTTDGDTLSGLGTPASPLSVPRVAAIVMRATSAQSIANNTNTQLLWNSEVLDTDGFHNLVSNTDRVTVPTGKGGLYLVVGQIYWGANDTNYRQISILHWNSSAVLQGSGTATDGAAAAGVNRAQQVTYIGAVAATDYFTMQVYQNSGGALDANTSNTHMRVVRLGD